jgi:hypothetical protein
MQPAMFFDKDGNIKSFDYNIDNENTLIPLILIIPLIIVISYLFILVIEMIIIP